MADAVCSANHRWARNPAEEHAGWARGGCGGVHVGDCAARHSAGEAEVLGDVVAVMLDLVDGLLTHPQQRTPRRGGIAI